MEDLKEAIKDLPDNMPIIIPVITEKDVNLILAFRHVRTIGILNDLSLTNINNLFGNCVILNCPDNILSLEHKLGKFILLMNAFYNLKAYNK